MHYNKTSTETKKQCLHGRKAELPSVNAASSTYRRNKQQEVRTRGTATTKPRPDLKPEYTFDPNALCRFCAMRDMTDHKDKRDGQIDDKLHDATTLCLEESHERAAETEYKLWTMSRKVKRRVLMIGRMMIWNILEHRPARGPGPARDLILSGPPSHLSKIKIYQVC